jgi:murein DD-endopeptidase MepM/ murein hydrolase activator NlpD
MQILITHGSLARSRVLQFNRLQLAATVAGIAALLVLLSVLLYHFVFLSAAREGWPIVSQVVKLVSRDESAQRERFLRENLDAMAQKVGEMQAKLLKLEALGDRVSGLAGVKPEEFKPLLRPAAAASMPAMAVKSAQGGQGGPFIPGFNIFEREAFSGLNTHVGSLDERTDQTIDLFTLIESRLLEGRLSQLMVPSSPPVNGPVGSGFGFRSDPFSGRAALHTGLDFPADIGTPILAAAGGMVVTSDSHPAYGNLVEIDHGNGLMTRYGHTSKMLVKAGDLVKRGQVVALVGNSGRSTGPHLHFEVLVEGVPQNPARFLAGRGAEGRHQNASARSR